MVIIPCSMKTLSGVVNSYADNLIVRAADVTLKERRRLVLVPRESPMHVGPHPVTARSGYHGCGDLPAGAGFYNHPQSVDDIINHTVGRVLDLFGLDCGTVKRWQGPARNHKTWAMSGGKDARSDPLNAWRRGHVFDQDQKRAGKRVRCW